MEHKKIHLPEDAMPHNSIIEWWYFNGHLKDAKGNKYAFMDCLFRAYIKKVDIPFLKQPFKNFEKIPYACFAHSLLSDIGRQKNYKDVQLLSLLSHDSFTHPMLYANYLNPISVNGFSTSEIVETSKNAFHIKTERIDLDLKARKRPVLQGDNGIISVSDRESYYYSLTDLVAEGMINIDGKWISVRGKAWMDHQWADASYRKDKWTWFSVQLENGTDVMCVEYDDHMKKDRIVSFTDKNGRSRTYKDFEVAHGDGVWESKKTKARYPTSWTVKVPEEKIELKIHSTMSDQEVIFGDINYWEGPTAVTAKIGAKTVGGQGFMELVGYPSDYNALILAGKELNSRIQKEALLLLKKIF